MDRAAIAKHLVQAEGHVRLGEKHIGTQRAIVAHFEASGQDSAQARDVLDTFISMQTSHVADRDRLRVELAQANVAPFTATILEIKIDPPIPARLGPGGAVSLDTIESVMHFIRRHDPNDGWQVREAAFVAAAVPSDENIDALRKAFAAAFA